MTAKMTFNVKYTPKGATVHFNNGHRVTSQSFRNGYAHPQTKVDEFIHSKIAFTQWMHEQTGREPPEFEVIGHTLSKKTPLKSELTEIIEIMIPLLVDTREGREVKYKAKELLSRMFTTTKKE